MENCIGAPRRRASSPVAVVLVGDGVDRHRLEASPADGEDERVTRLQQAAEPAVALQAQLQEAAALFRGRQAPDQQRLCRVPVLDQLAWDACAMSVTVWVYCKPLTVWGVT